MKLTDWAHTAEIVSAVAVVLSLLYVGFGINQNTRAIRSGTHQALLDSSQELDYVKLANPHVLSAILHAETTVLGAAIKVLSVGGSKNPEEEIYRHSGLSEFLWKKDKSKIMELVQTFEQATI